MELVTIGQVLRPRGINGEVHVRAISDYPERFLTLKEVFVICEDSRIKYSVIFAKVLTKTISLRLEAVESREDAERLKGCYLAVDRSNVFELPDDAFYIYELIGCSVVNAENIGRGNVRDVMQASAQDILVIDWSNREVLVPFVAEFIVNVDLEKNIIKIREIEGLFSEE